MIRADTQPEDVAASQLPLPVVDGDTVKLRAEPSLAEICSVWVVGELPPTDAAKESDGWSDTRLGGGLTVTVIATNCGTQVEGWH